MASSVSEAEEQMHGLSAKYRKAAIPGLVEKKVPLTGEDVKDLENIGGKIYEVIGEVDRNFTFQCQHAYSNTCEAISTNI